MSSAGQTAAYHHKRSRGKTDEPFGSRRRTGGRLFVVHHHLARREHYDLRLEVGGELWSWAVPRGPSPNPEDKRLAVMTEPHPLDYGFYEGVIPEGQYGAGPSIIWDQGSWQPLEDPLAGLEKGKLLFALHGFKLVGRWTLVRTREQWLLIKERDTHASEAGTEDYPSQSVLSGLTAAERAEPEAKRKRVRTALRRAGAAPAAMESVSTEPMLCENAKPFSADDWLFEIKYDGYRAVLCRSGEKISVRSRRGSDFAANFPEIAEALGHLPFEEIILDAEIVCHDEAGLPSFQALQRRALLSGSADVERARVASPASAYVFDLLYCAGLDCRKLPLSKRKKLLGQIIPRRGYLRYVDHLVREGEALFTHAIEMGLEGVVAKRAASSYVHQRSREWRKIAGQRTADLAVVGYRPLKGRGAGIGSLHVAERVAGGWQYRGRVGSGLTEESSADLEERLADRGRTRPVVDVAGSKADTWVEPDTVVSVRFKQLTREGNLRQPVFLGIRPDRSVGETSLDRALPEPVAVHQQRPEVEQSNRDKIFWPEAGLSKGELLDYYEAISPWMLPYLRDRPVVLTRYPDGIDGKSFFQHNVPDFVPDWIRREHFVDEEDEKGKTYFIIDDEETLLYLANLGTIPIHAWSCRIASLARPDWITLDLDPKGASFSSVIALAKETRAICDAAAMPLFVKTTGKSGLHVLIPGAGLEHEQAKTLAIILATIVNKRCPEISTLERRLEKRAGKVYLDALQNGRGKTIAAPFSAREVVTASVSMPLGWHECRRGLDPARFTIVNAARRMKRLRDDPMAKLLEVDCDMLQALHTLQNLLEE